MKDDTNRKTGLAVGMAIIGLLVGAAIAYPLGKNMNESSMSGTSQSMSSPKTKAADLRVTMNNLLREHVSTSLTVTRSIVDQAPEEKLQGAVDAQTANAVAIANAVGSVYGDEAKTAITAPFVDHIMQSNNYAKAVEAGDMAAQETSLVALRADLRKVADVFNSVIPSLSSDTLYDALNAHENLLNESIREYKAGNFAKAYELESQALTQISGGADALTGGIIESKPDMFKS